MGADIIMSDGSSLGGSSQPLGGIFWDPNQRSPAAEPTTYQLVESQLRKALAS